MPDTNLTALTQFIPLQNGQAAFLKTQNLINNLLGNVGYEVRENFVVFTEDITNPDGQNINSVDMQLVILDFDKYSDYDLLPLTADMAADVISEVIQLLAPTLPEDGRVDSKATETPNKRVME